MGILIVASVVIVAMWAITLVLMFGKPRGNQEGDLW